MYNFLNLDNPVCKRNLNTDDHNEEEIELFVKKEKQDTHELNKKGIYVILLITLGLIKKLKTWLCV